LGILVLELQVALIQAVAVVELVILMRHLHYQAALVVQELLFLNTQTH
jgi:hypothetical protein